MYDIVDDKRRNKIFELLSGNGNHVQYSVFFCDLNQKEQAQLRLDIRAVINDKEDQILFIDMGLAEGAIEMRVEAIGKPYTPPSRTNVI